MGMDEVSQLKIVCESYVKRAMAAHKFDLMDFAEYMEPAFARLGYRASDPGKKESILVIRMDEIGNCVMTSGFLRELRRNRPQAHITLVVSPLVEPLFELCPHVDEVFEFSSGQGTSLQDVLRGAVNFCLRHLWERHYDLCFCPQWGVDRSWTLLLGFLSGARERVGYSEGVSPEKRESNRGYDRLLTRPLVSPPEVLHEVSRSFYLLQDFGMDVQNDTMEVWFDDQDRLIAHRLLVNFMEDHPVAVVALGAGRACKKYPVERYVTALRSISESGMRFVLLGGTDVDLEGSFFTRTMPRGTVLNLVGQTYLRVTAAILSMADLYIGNDTGIVHLAAALGIPVIEVLAEAADKEDDKGIYSCYERFYPWHTPAIVLRPPHALPPCDHTAVLGGCSTTMPHCICRIEPEEIVAAYNAMADYLDAKGR